MPRNIIHRQLGHANLGTTSIDTEEIIAAVHRRRARAPAGRARAAVGA
jgi:hypothetical protein